MQRFFGTNQRYIEIPVKFHKKKYHKIMQNPLKSGPKSMKIGPKTSIKNHRKNIKIHQKAISNPSQIGQKSMKTWFLVVLGAKSSPGQLQDARGEKNYSSFDRSLAKNDAPRVDFGTPGNSKICKKSHFALRSALGPSKNGLWEGVRTNHEKTMKNKSKITGFSS